MPKDYKKLRSLYDRENAAFYKKVDGSRRIDNSFAMPDDIPLTEEEIAAIDAYWGKYKFAYPNIDYKSFQTFKNRYGKFDVRHCPGAIRTSYFTKHFIDSAYSRPFQHKGMQQFLYPNIKQPRTFVRSINGIYLNEEYEPLTIDEVIDTCIEAMRVGCDLIIKPNHGHGGRGIVVFDAKTTKPRTIRDHITKTLKGSAFVIQEVLVQSEFMARFNNSSVNTLRITSLLYKGQVRVLAALIRIGCAGNRVDNWCSGGSILGVDVNTGKCCASAMLNDRTTSSKLSSGIDLEKESLIVPNFEEVKRQVIASHYRIPYIRMISWDVALDKENTPILIENNFGGMIQIHEATTGPLFGELMDDLLDEYLLEKFYLHFATEDFICREYHNRVEIEEYIGASGDVTVPKELRDKPVTKIMADAFKESKITGFSASISVMKNSPEAMKTLRI